MRRQTTGEGPLCPITPSHGRMLVHIDWDNLYWCPSHAHGGNGHFFKQSEANDLTIDKEIEMQIYETTAKSIISGTTEFEDGVRDIARQTKQGSAKVRTKLHTMVDAINEAATRRTEERETAQKQNAEKAQTERKTRSTKGQKRGPRKEWVSPEQFAAVRDKYGLSNTAIAMQMGKSPSRMTELTRGTKATQGGSVDVFDQFVAACEALAAEAEE